jgi:hypothetical protein
MRQTKTVNRGSIKPFCHDIETLATANHKRSFWKRVSPADNRSTPNSRSVYDNKGSLRLLRNYRSHGRQASRTTLLGASKRHGIRCSDVFGVSRRVDVISGTEIHEFEVRCS